MLAVDLSRIDTFVNLHNWLKIAQESDTKPILFLVGTKNDLEREVDRDLLEEWIRDQNVCYFIETSALTGENVNDLFDVVSSELINRWENSHTN